MHIKRFAPILIYASMCTLVQAEQPSVSTLLVYYRAPTLTTETAEQLAKFDVLVLDRFRYQELTPNSWSEIKKHGDANAQKPKIFIYQLGPLIRDDQDKMPPYWLNNMGRFNNDRGIANDAIAISHKNWFLKNSLTNNLKISDNEYFLDFSSTDFQSYWERITQQDINDQKWKADGVFIDVCSPYYFSAADKILGNSPAKYVTPKAWDQAMNNYVSEVSRFLRTKNQLSISNRSQSNTKTGYDAWLQLDQSATAPDYVMEEGSFVTSYGPSDAQLLPLTEWEQQVSMASTIKNSAVIYVSHTDIDIDKAGVTSNGNTMTFQEVFQFALGSYLLAIPQSGKKPLFDFDYGRLGTDTKGYIHLAWSPVYEQLQLGEPISELEKQQSGNATIFRRRFINGVVYVNPSNQASAAFQLDGMQIVTPDWHKGLVVEKDSNIYLPPYSARILVSPNPPKAPNLLVSPPK